METIVTMWGAIAVSILTLLIFTAALTVAFVTKNDTMMSLTVGAAVANATTAVGYWLGSSSSAAHRVTAPAAPTQEAPHA